ncbi:MAG TPA: methyltransferase domain-containing protein [Candidatus Angelobacter sp.]
MTRTSLRSRAADAEPACMSPLAAYDALAPFYSSLLQARKQYLAGIEKIIALQSCGACSLLDIGSGNGVRALRIAGACGIESVVLVEPSDGMRRESPESHAVWKHSTSEISEDSRFDLITCLWNVLGHVDGARERLVLLSKLKTFLGPSGMLFLDVNHRYNAGSYGWTRTAGRIMRDYFFPSEKNGDVIASWQAGQHRIRTRGHVFTHAELMPLFHSAGLQIKNRWIVDYRNGMQRTLSVFGNLLYQLTA